jgi:ElaB/YqjD/DUF883 family membrane-anchored ribosome-binding protein
MNENSLRSKHMMAKEQTANADGVGVTTDKLMADVRVLGTDMEQLLRATASQTGQHVAEVRARAEDSLNAARARLVDLQAAVLARTRAAGRATDDYVRANPWQVIAISAAAGLAVGLLLTRNGASDS